jgi:tripartite-type tricarboxylate transporter receptor subunit TctC
MRLLHRALRTPSRVPSFSFPSVSAPALRGLCLASVAALLVAAAPGVRAAGAADFYKGKTVTIAVGFSAGGGFDIYSRILARHIGKHIAGTPTVIVSNVPGAASFKAVQSLQAMPHDGTQIVAFNPGLVSQSLLEPNKVAFRFTDVSFLGSITSETPVCYAWGKTGIKTFDDLMKMKSRKFNLGATAPGTTAYIEGALLKNVFQAPIKQITGYPGSDEQRIAIERGELDGSCGSWDSIPQDWIKEKKFNALVRYSKTVPSDMKPEAPFITDIADPEQKKIMAVVLAINDMYRPYIVAKDVPADRLKTLRDGFWATVNDPAFLKEAERGGRSISGPARGEDVEKIVADIYATPPALVKKAADAIK